MYLLYKRGSPFMVRCFSSFSRMYQLATNSCPSGFAATHSMMSSFNRRRVSASLRVNI